LDASDIVQEYHLLYAKIPCVVSLTFSLVCLTLVFAALHDVPLLSICVNFPAFVSRVSSVLWCWWLGGRNGIRPV